MEIDFNDLFYATRDAQILWKKRRQHAQGKIDLRAGDEGCKWEEYECSEMIKHYEKIERWLWKQLPDRVQLEATESDYVIASLRLIYDPATE